MIHCQPLGLSALDVVMPMHLVLDPDATVRHAGPTLGRLRPMSDLVGRSFFELFEVRRPRHLSIIRLGTNESIKVQLNFRHGKRTSLKGVVVGLPEEEGILVNLSFGIDVIEAVRDYDLTAADFAATDLAVEMLYLVEAKSAVMDESRNLNLRLQRAKMAAEQQAFTDTLTGVRNRRALDQVMGRMIDSATPFTLMHLDLDFFKEVNDTLGHAAGDHVLRTVAERLTGELRADDMIARLGGDEFVIILNALTDPEQVDAIADRLIARVQEPVAYEGHPCEISTSIGSTASTRYDAPNADRMLRDADAALYASKRAGRRSHIRASDDLAREGAPLERRLAGRAMG